MSKTLPFSYFGSKYRSFDFINSKLPRTRQYIEPFGGAGTILLSREPVPMETYNDLYDDIPLFFRVLREREVELLDALTKTPYSREEYAHAVEQRSEGYPDCGELERARLFFVLMQQSRSHRQHDNVESAWKYKVRGNVGRGSDEATATWKSRVKDTLPTIAGRLTDVQIESKPAIEVIETHDRDTATFYVDPPYPHDTRGSASPEKDYSLELSVEDHRKLADVLGGCEGYVVVSGYANELYDDDLFAEWNRYTAGSNSAGEGSGKRTEVLWTNYDANELGGRKIGDWPEPTRKGKQLTLTGAVGESTFD